jgi:hypothetical protein
VSHLGGFIGLLSGGFILSASNPHTLLMLSGMVMTASGAFWFLLTRKQATE